MATLVGLHKIRIIMNDKKKRMQVFDKHGMGEVSITITMGDPRYSLRAVVEEGMLRVELPEAMQDAVADDAPGCGGLPSGLPSGLRWRCEHPAAWGRAVEQGFVAATEEGWRWTAGSLTLLAYFCGRLACDDSVRRSKRCGYVWVKGCGMFPGKSLNRLFGVGTLRQLRDKGLGQRAPDGHEAIDRLFEPEAMPAEAERRNNKDMNHKR